MRHTRLTRYLLILLIVVFISACDSNTSTAPTDINTTTEFTLQEKQWVHQLFQTAYLWYNDVTNSVEYDNYTTPSSLVSDLRVTPPDYWSFSITKQEYDDIANQSSQGFGFMYNSNYQILHVREGSPASNTLLRGDQLLKVNDQNVSRQVLTTAKESETPVSFTLLRDNSETTVSITPAEYSFSVTKGSVIQQNNKTIGYMQYNSFTESSTAEFEKIFTTFKQSDIDELIIDLRYNGGGSVDVTSALLDNITNAYPGQRQIYLDWNANYQSQNENYTFESVLFQDGNELTMEKVYFLTTHSSASASEALINALIPYLGEENVITIGDDTHGKPVGMAGFAYPNSNNYYFLINFYVRNDDGDTTSFSGIAPTCSANDDLTHQRGDTAETMLAAALYYIENSSCPLP